MSPEKQRGTVQRWWTACPLDRLFTGITATVLVFLFIVLALGIRHYLLYDQCRQAVTAGDRLLFQFTALKDHLNESLIVREDVNLRVLDSELQTLEKEAEGLTRNILVPEGLKASLLSRADLVGLEVRLRAIQEQRPEKSKETAELVRSLNTININLQQFRFLLGDYTQTILLGLHKIIAGALGLIVALTCALLFLLNRHLARPVLNLCRMTAANGNEATDAGPACSFAELTARISDLMAAANERGPGPKGPDRLAPDQLQRQALRYRYAVAGCIGSELASEITNIINGVINYTQTLIDIDDQGSSRQQCAVLYQALLKEEKKIAELVAGMHLVSQGHGSRAPVVSLPALFKMLALVLDKPLRAESIVFTVPADCRYQVSVPAGELWLVLLTLVQLGRRVLNQAFPGKKPEQTKTIAIEWLPQAHDSHRLTLRCTNSAFSWDDAAADGAAWPSLAFCTLLLQEYQSSLTAIAHDQGHQLLLDLPHRNSVA